MPFKQYRVKAGQPILAAEFNNLLDEVHRLAKLAVHPPLFLTQSAAGMQIGFDGPITEVAYVKFEAHEGDTYPASTDNCKIYPAIKRPKVSHVEATTCTDNLTDAGDTDDEKGEELKVWSLTEQFIPEDTVALIFQTNGSWFTEWVRESVRGKLDAQLTEGGSADMSVWAGETTDADTNENIEVHDWLLGTSDTITADSKVIAFFDRESKKYYVGSAQCPNA